MKTNFHQIYHQHAPKCRILHIFVIVHVNYLASDSRMYIFFLDSHMHKMTIHTKRRWIDFFKNSFSSENLQCGNMQKLFAIL